jgi:hypothetical protein
VTTPEIGSLTVAVRTSLLSCRKAGKTRAFTPVRASSGEIRTTQNDAATRGEEDFNMLKFPLALIAVPGVLLTLATRTVAQTVPPNLPAAIICYAQADQSWRVGYLFRVNKNGDAIYIAPDGRLSAMVNAKGVVAAPTNRPAGVDCYGKTLDELRSSGRIMEFQRTR